MHKLKWNTLIIAWVFLLAASLSTHAQVGRELNEPASGPMVVRYYDRGIKDARHAYKFELIKRSLEVTRPEFGDYRTEPFGEEPSAKRKALLINSGALINIVWASPGTVIARADVFTIPVDILRGLLGYRVCLINPANFPDSKSLLSLNQLHIAQGANWSDIDIYEHNGIAIQQSPTFEGLFDMLGAKRYECLPLGADEVMHSWREQKTKYPFLAVEPKVLIYYDYPIYLYVSKQYPRLAQRIEIGLQKLQRSGEFDRLFKQYHAADIAQLHLSDRRIFCLKSPFLPAQGQCDKKLNYPK